MFGGIETPLTKFVNLVGRRGHIGTLGGSEDFIRSISGFCKDI
jgi:hypothetical protein